MELGSHVTRLKGYKADLPPCPAAFCSVCDRYNEHLLACTSTTIFSTQLTQCLREPCEQYAGVSHSLSVDSSN
jgi:hypothetical protein